MKRIVLVISLICVALCVCVCGMAWGEESFVVLGKSERGEDVPNPTWEMAIQDGLMRAVENAVRAQLPSTVVERKQETLSTEFYQKAASFVLSYKIVEKTALPTGYQALLDVVVDTKGIEGKLASLGLLKGREEGPRVREVQLVVSGIRSYQIYLTIEQLLREDAAVQAFSIAEIEPTKFTWEVRIQGEVGGLANKLLVHDFGAFKARVVSLSPARAEVMLSH
jgi:hypothetical protein